MSSNNSDTHLLIFNVTLSVLFYLYDLKFCNQNLNHVMFTEQFCSSTKECSKRLFNETESITFITWFKFFVQLEIQ